MMTEEMKKEKLEQAQEFYRQGNYEQSMNLLEVLIQNLSIEEDVDLYLVAQIVAGNACSLFGYGSRAVQYYLDAAYLAKKHNRMVSYGRCLNNIGSRYMELEDYRTAEDYLKRAIHAFAHAEKELSVNEKELELIVCCNLLTTYRLLEEWDNVARIGKHANNLADVFRKEVNRPRAYEFSILGEMLILHQREGDIEFVENKLEDMIGMLEDPDDSMAFEQDVPTFNSLLIRMGRFDYLDRSISIFEKYAETQDGMRYQVQAVEMRLEYYKYAQNKEKYNALCVEYVRTKRRQKQQEREEELRMLSNQIHTAEREMETVMSAEERKRLEHQSKYDALTGIPNRYFLDEYAAKVFREAAALGQKVTMGIIDVDDFKQYNDVKGHVEGDNCLKLCASVLAVLCHDSGECFRFGGDEFVVILKNKEKAAVEEIAAQIKRKTYMVPVSQGYYIGVPQNGEEVSVFLQKADRALYEIKRKHKNDFIVREEVS